MSAHEGGETPLKVFVSSVMNPQTDDVGWARTVAVEALKRLPIVRPWAFEFTPASSERRDDSYLRHVRDADMVIWLTRSATTPAVKKEVETAVAEGRRVLAFLLPGGNPDDLTRELRNQVADRLKWKEVSSNEGLQSEIVAALGDEFI